MKRCIDYYLSAWKQDPSRRPLLLRGARQVGKTHAARQLGKQFTHFVEINLELEPELKIIFEKSPQPARIIHELSLVTNRPIIAGKTLLFIDEIQAVPQAITALRYFYELMPELHVIAAGSLLDFVIEQVGIPVGRIQSLYVYPLSFMEFLAACRHHLVIKEILTHGIGSALAEPVHTKLLELIGQYMAIGGMPQAVWQWISMANARSVATVHHILGDTYRQDFGKYAKKNQIKYVELLFDQIPLQLGKKFKYSLIDGQYRKRELVPALDLLVTAGVAHKVFYSAGQGVPLGAQIDPEDYKAIFLDVGLSQAVLGIDLAGWFLNPATQLVNKGALVEAFVGQEILAYSCPTKKNALYYWHRQERSSQAEVDYLMQANERVLPIEVKSGAGSTLKSLHMFLDTHTSSNHGIRFSTQNYSVYQKIYSFPLYAIAPVVSAGHGISTQALESLIV